MPTRSTNPNEAIAVLYGVIHGFSEVLARPARAHVHNAHRRALVGALPNGIPPYVRVGLMRGDHVVVDEQNEGHADTVCRRDSHNVQHPREVQAVL